MGKPRQGAFQLEVEQSPNRIYIFSTVPRCPLTVSEHSLSLIPCSPSCLAFHKQSHATRATRDPVETLRQLFLPTLTNHLPEAGCMHHLSLDVSALSPGSQPNPFTVSVPSFYFSGMGQGLYWKVQVSLIRVLQRQNFSSNKQDRTLFHSPNLALIVMVAHTLHARHPKPAF